MIDGMYHPTPEGTPQGGPLSPLLSNIVLNELDKELDQRGHPFVLYADENLIFCRSRHGAERVCKGIAKFLGYSIPESLLDILVVSLNFQDEFLNFPVVFSIDNILFLFETKCDDQTDPFVSHPGGYLYSVLRNGGREYL